MQSGSGRSTLTTEACALSAAVNDTAHAPARRLAVAYSMPAHRSRVKMVGALEVIACVFVAICA
jgi:hypothetical protein